MKKCGNISKTKHMNKLNFSPESLKDLDEIWDYIFNNLKSPFAAQNTVNSILDSIEKLRKFPEMGSLLSAFTDIENDYRLLICGNYIAFYHTIDNEVNIDRILYGRRNYLHILFGN